MSALSAIAVGIACLLFVHQSRADRPAKSAKIRIVTVVKRTGIAWFERMELGIRKFGVENGIEATMTGAADADPQKQAQIIRKLISEKPSAITVVPNSPEALEGVLKEAREAGIKVVTHEAGNQVNTDVDIEAFDNLAYGAHLMDELASCMGAKGEYVAFVGHTTARSHMRWVGAAYERAKQKYPEVNRVSPPVESGEHLDTAYQQAKKLLAKYPELKGFEGSSVIDIAGIGKAVREAGRQNSTCVMGTSLPSVAGDYLSDGAVDKIFLWDPVIAGQAQDKLALMLIRGEKIGPGTDLGLPGYRSLKRIPDTPHALAGSGWIAIDKGNVGNYQF
ncbi:MAG: autoinducer 2 ABC transporter substrate-binding protein [Acidobacteria bacterium]|nr:autoinducer 2 ABC transporter substrate-binding protein [Acidobacteriota bacterium]